MKLTEIRKVAGLDRVTFRENYLDPQKPVVFTDLSEIGLH